MEYIVFDTEDTGLSSHDEVFQFAGLLLNRDLRIQRIFNFYCYTQVPITEKARQITGMTQTHLMELSNGLYFEDYFYKLDIFRKKSLVWIAYNTAFDTRMINGTLTRGGLPIYSFGNPINNLNVNSGIHTFDVMQLISATNNGIKKKLSVAQLDLGYSSEKLKAMYTKLAKLVNLDTSVMEHNALYDAMVTWCLLVKHKKLCMF